MNGKTKDEYAEANIPPHVKAIDARRATEMRKPGNEKLAEWSQAISLALEDLARIQMVDIHRMSLTYRENTRQHLEALQAEIVEAMGK